MFWVVKTDHFGIKTMARKDEIVWLRRESVTYKILFDEQTPQFCKSYNLDEVQRAYREVFGDQATVPILFAPYSLDTQIHLYDREVKFLKALADVGLDKTKGGMVPRVCEENRKDLRIFMEYLPQGTYQSEFFKAGDDEIRKNQLTTELVKNLADFHQYCKEDLDHIRLEVNNDGKIRLRTRSLEEEIERWEKHLLMVLFTYGENLPDYLKRPGNIPPRPREIRKGIKTFLEKYGVDLNQTVREFIENDRAIISNEITFIHGDYRPQNVFYIPGEVEGESREIKVCDLDKARLGSPLEDLTTALDNLFRYPFSESRELFSQHLAQTYFEKRRYSREELRDNLAGLVSFRLKEAVRYFGVNSQLGWKEISSFLGEQATNNFTGEPEQRKRSFLQRYFLDSLTRFFPYYLPGGEGFKSTIEPSLHNKRMVLRQLNLMNKIFHICGVPVFNSPPQQKKNKKKEAA